MTDRFYQVGNAVVLAGVLVTNALANALPIAGRTTGEVSDMYPNLFTPAGITFSIWGVLYLGLLIFVVLQFRGFSGKRPAPDYISSIGPWFMINGVCNVCWILVWHHLLLIPSLVFMAGILTTLVIIYRRLDGYSWDTYGWVKAPFSAYLAWICVASLANVTAFLTDAGYGGEPLGPRIWTAVLATGAAITGFWMLIRYRDPFFSLVICWALAGIVIKLRASYDWGVSPVWVAGVLAILLLGGTLMKSVQVLLLRKRTTT